MAFQYCLVNSPLLRRFHSPVAFGGRLILSVMSYMLQGRIYSVSLLIAMIMEAWDIETVAKSVFSLFGCGSCFMNGRREAFRDSTVTWLPSCAVREYLRSFGDIWRASIWRYQPHGAILRKETFVVKSYFSMAEAMSLGAGFSRVNRANPGRLVCGGRLGLYPAFPSFTRGDLAKVISNLPFAIRAL